MKIKNLISRMLLLVLCHLVFASGIQTVFAQEHRWLRIGELQSFISDRGMEVEGEGYDANTNFFSWPAQYGVNEQTTARQKCLWIGAKNFYDTVLDRALTYKVVSIGPRDSEVRQNMIFEKSIKVIAKYPAPVVVVDEQIASPLATYEQIDEYDETLPCDRMIVIKFNTSIGISVTKKVLAFSHPDHNNYYIYDYTFKNTGIINRDDEVHEQTLEDVYFYSAYRYAFAGESNSGLGLGWGAFSSAWGASTINHAFGNNSSAAIFNDPASPLYQMRAFYSFYGPNRDRTTVTYDEDWGCPNELEDGVMSSAKYAGCVTLHADKSVSDQTDDFQQPRTTWYVSSDEGVWSASESQYDEIYMQQRYRFMSEGDPPQSHAELIAANYVYAQEFENVDTDRNVGGGTSQGQGYGPYTMAPGDSVHIVIAEGVDGIDREKNREVGGNWLQYFSGTGTPTLIMPDGSSAPDHNTYKRAWVQTGVDSIIKTYRNAMENYNASYAISQGPPPPNDFTVTSGGDRIQLSWSDNAASDPHFDGYVIYRAEGTVLGPDAVYKKVFECDASNAVHTWDDVTAARGFNYYYYIQTKDDGTQNTLNPGKPQYSSLFWTITSLPAYLRRPAGVGLNEVRVVPNPYDIRARSLQFGDVSQYDRLAFYELPPVCKLKIFTERGDLIWEKEHIDGSGDELWDSLTSSGQIVVSGIYILYVEVTEDIQASDDVYARRDYYDPKYTKKDYSVIRTDTSMVDGVEQLKDVYGNIYTPGGEPVYRQGDLLFEAGDLMYRKGQSVYRKFVIIR